MSVHEHSFDINEFNEPKVYENANAVMALFTRLLLLDPGTIQSHPKMGVGLVTKYRYSEEGTESELQADIRQQIDAYLPQFHGAEVTVKFENKAFQIAITVNDYIFAFVYDIEATELSTKFGKLSDI